MKKRQLGLFDRQYPEHLYKGKPPSVAGSDTSAAAADSVRETSGAQRQRVFALIAESPRTDEEIERVTGLRHQSASARRRELVLAGHIVDSGARRANSSGRQAVVWRVAS